MLHLPGVQTASEVRAISEQTHANSSFSLLQGKVRDTYDLGDKIVVITTDRQSAFDRLLASIPFKGQVLNQTSAWWFDQTTHIVANAVINVPDPNVVVMKKCKVFPVEFVVRGFLTGESTSHDDCSVFAIAEVSCRCMHLCMFGSRICPGPSALLLRSLPAIAQQSTAKDFSNIKVTLFFHLPGSPKSCNGRSGLLHIHTNTLRQYYHGLRAKLLLSPICSLQAAQTRPYGLTTRQVRGSTAATASLMA